MTTARKTQLRKIFNAAWTIFRKGGKSFSAALKAAWAESRKPEHATHEVRMIQVKIGAGCTYKQADYLGDLMVENGQKWPFPSLSQAQKRIGFEAAKAAIEAALAGQLIVFI